MQPATATISIPQLRTHVRGTVIAPDDPGYDEARTIVSGEFDRRPGVIVRVADADDVAHVVKLARDTHTELAVRSGGHSGAGHSASEGGIVLDLRGMTAIEIDVEGRTAWAEAGLTAGEFTTAAAAHGLAVGFGDTATVGLGGITLGGGVGYLVRKHGLTIDNLLAAEIVTADGKLLHVDGDTHPDLFWGIRGGGGNFGVATRFKYRLHPLEGIVGGILVLPATPDTVAEFMSAADAAPDELSTIANVMTCPPMPFVPEEHHGGIVILAMLTYAGSAENGERAMAPFRALAEPLADLVRPMTYPEMFPPQEGEGDYHPTAAARTMFVDSIDRAAAEMLLERLKASDAPMRVAQLRVLGGAMARVSADATAFAHRGSRIMVNVAAFYEGAADRAGRQAWVDDLAEALHQGDDGAYVNFLGTDGEERIRAAYPGATWDRLSEIKDRYDPTNLFRMNQNIAPTGQ
ncbi:MAG: FAD-binding oxidoreductase [Chloroflexota bacterium]|nr:FAD-binding oxidoreductase [Chloroflexota bacterium]